MGNMHKTSGKDRDTHNPDSVRAFHRGLITGQLFNHDSSLVNIVMGLLQLRYEHDSSTIRARYNILRGVMCFRAIMNMSILSRGCRMLYPISDPEAGLLFIQ